MDRELQSIKAIDRFITSPNNEKLPSYLIFYNGENFMTQEPEKFSIENMAKQIEADIMASEEPITDELGSSRYLAKGEEIDKILEETKNPDMDPVIAFFKLKYCLKRDLDLIQLGYDRYEELHVIPRLHELLPQIILHKEFLAVDKKFMSYKVLINANSDKSNSQPTINLFEFYWSKILQNSFTRETLRENISKNFFMEYHYTIVGLPTTKANIEYEIYNQGIKKIATRYNENDPNNPIITESVIWSWGDFRILQVLKDINDTETIYKFNFKFNNDIYLDKSLVEMRDLIYDTSCKSTGKDKQIFGPLVQAYIDSGDIPIMQYSGVCGYTREGWRMPDEFYVKFTPVQAKIRACIYAMCKMKVTEAEARDMMKLLYNAVSIKHRDILFAHSAIMPFLFALRDTTDLLYWLALGSASGNTGKTPAGVMITQKIWYNLNRPFITKDQASSESRLGDFISSSTFGILIDDCGDLPEEIENTLKSYITGEAGFTRKNTDQTSRIDKDYTNPVVLAFNKTPAMFNDVPFLSRGIYIPVDDRPTKEQVKTFKDAWKLIPRGYLGKYIYEKLKDRDIEYFINLYEFASDWQGSPSPRANVIYKLLGTGALLFKELFGIQLDLSEVPNLILKTLELGSDDIFTIVLNQVEDGCIEEDYKANPENENTKEGNAFKPRRKWITAPLIYKSSRKFDGYIYTADNLADMNARLKLKNPIDLPGLAEILRKRWDAIEYTTAKIQDKAFKCVYIPKNSVFKEDPEDPDAIEEKKLQEAFTGNADAYIKKNKHQNQIEGKHDEISWKD